MKKLNKRWEPEVKRLLREVVSLASLERELWPVEGWARWCLEHGRVVVRGFYEVLGYLDCLIWNGLGPYERALAVRERLLALRWYLHYRHDEGEVVEFEGEGVAMFWRG